MSTETKPRTALINARVGFGFSRKDAATRMKVSDETLRLIENGTSSGAITNKRIIALCKWFSLLAFDEGYDHAQFHQAVLCPDDFPAALAAKDGE